MSMGGQESAPVTYIVCQGASRASHQRGQTLLGALTAHQDKPVIDMDIAHIEPNQLTHAQAATVKHFQDGMIAQPHLALGKVLIEQCRDILHRKVFRQAICLFGQAQRRRRVLGHGPIAHQKGMQALHGSKRALHRGVGIASVAAIGNKALHDLTAHIFKRRNVSPLQIGAVRRQVTTVGRNRIARKTPLDRKVIEILPRHHSKRRGSSFGMFLVLRHP